MLFRRKNLTVSMGVADIGDFTAKLSLSVPKAVGRFKRSGQPDLMGNHLYTVADGGIYVCALRTNNGTLDKPLFGPYFWRGVVRYTSYKLVAPQGYVIVMEDGTVATEVELSNGLTLEFLPRATIQSRFAICKPNQVAAATAKLLYQDGTGSARQPLAGTYGPSELPLPTTGGINYDGLSTNEYNQWLNAWRTGVPIGTWESTGPRIGPRMPAGLVPPYAHGGDGIDPNHGYEQCRADIVLRRWKHSRWMDRMNAAMFDQNGRQMRPLDFSVPQLIQHISGPGYWQGENELPVFLTGTFSNYQYPKFNPGQVDLQAETWEFKSVWVSHYIRAIQNGIAVWEYTHDPMIADDLLMLFENMRFTVFSDRGDELEEGSGYTPPSIRAYLYDVSRWPHQGSSDLDRASGWSMYLGAQVNRMGFNRRSWLRKMKVLHDRAMMSTGIAGRKFSPNFPRPDIQGIQTFHEMIIAIGYHAVCTQLGKNAAGKLVPMCKSILDNPLLPPIAEEYHPNGSQKGPPHWIWTHINYNDPVQIQAQYSNMGGDAAHVMQVLALTYLSTQDPHWLDVSVNHWWVAASSQGKLSMLQGMVDKSWGGTLQAVLEQYFKNQLDISAAS